MVRSSRTGTLSFDPEIEKTAGQLRQQTKRAKQRSSLPLLSEIDTVPDLVESSSDSEEQVMDRPAPVERTLRELAEPDLNQQPLCIQYVDLEVNFELKSGLIHLLPKFHGFAGEDPHKHLKEFHVVCSSMRPQGVTEEQIKLRAFSFSVDGLAKDWLYYLPPGSITMWNDLKKQFLEKYFPASRAANIRKDICGIRQLPGETLYEYWERFKQLCASCPQHQISDQLLIQYFYEGLSLMDRSMIDVASGGVLVNKTPTQARELISNMAANAQQFGSRQDPTSRKVNEVNISSIEQRLDKLTSLVEKFVVGNVQQVKTCGICYNMGHSTDMCPTLQEEPVEQANAVGGFPGMPQRRYDPYAQTYNPGWKDHPNFSYGVRPSGFPQQYPLRQPAPPQSTSKSCISLEEIVKSLATNTQQFQQATTASIQNLENQMSQLATTVSRLESQVLGRLPSQSEVNPKQNVSAVILRSGKELQEPSKKVTEHVEDELEKNELMPQSQDAQPTGAKPLPIVIPPPFPSRFAKSKKEEQEKDILETFRKVEVNIPLLDAIKQIPRYAKVLKELCTSKRKLRGDEKVHMEENVSAVLQKKLPPKCKDPCMFTIPCKIGNVKVEKAMLDLGASINVMPRSIYSSLNVGPLKETGVIIQLADRSNAYPDGVLEDVLVQVNELVFPADFYVLDMEEDNFSNSVPILLGRPFLKTARTKMDVHKGTLTMEFDGEVIEFNMNDAMKYPSEEHSLRFKVRPLTEFLSNQQQQPCEINSNRAKSAAAARPATQILSSSPRAQRKSIQPSSRTSPQRKPHQRATQTRNANQLSSATQQCVDPALQRSTNQQREPALARNKAVRRSSPATQHEPAARTSSRVQHSHAASSNRAAAAAHTTATQQRNATSLRPVFQPGKSKSVSAIIVTMPKRKASSSKSSKKTPVAKKSKIAAPTTVPWNTISDSRQAVRQRSKHGKGMSVLPLAESNLEGCLAFVIQQEKERYKDISTRKILPAKYIHYPTLEKLNVKDNFDSLIDKIGLRKFVDVDCLGYVELIREFYATFQFNMPNDFTLHTPNVIKFRLMGQNFSHSITDFNLALGFIDDDYSSSDAYLGTTCDFSENFEPYGLWRNLSVDHNPVLKCVHRLLAYNFLGKKDHSGVFSKTEFYFIWCMLNDVRPNLGFWLADQFQSVLKRYKTLFLGPYITLLAINLCVLDPDNNDLHPACKKEFLDMFVFERTGVVEFKEGRFQFTEPGPTQLPKKLYARSGATSDDEFDDDTAAPPTIPSTSAPPLSIQLEKMEHKLNKMEQNLAAYFESVGFTPPFPPSP
ncbi:hypothetical protein KPL71_009511 [Citrus sinensis]|uniref:Uncharacterized protein n=1 Tax=Citrus sinensis TaxID=2711 RepID=A0ACB8MEH7_CITSI|nr:hypothetical protein KPL71_009511 [Citrus sinensis]